jgi:hypothetical protein
MRTLERATTKKGSKVRLRASIKMQDDADCQETHGKHRAQRAKRHAITLSLQDDEPRKCPQFALFL